MPPFHLFLKVILTLWSPTASSRFAAITGRHTYRTKCSTQAAGVNANRAPAGPDRPNPEKVALPWRTAILNGMWFFSGRGLVRDSVRSLAGGSVGSGTHGLGASERAMGRLRRQGRCGSAPG